MPTAAAASTKSLAAQTSTSVVAIAMSRKLGSLPPALLQLARAVVLVARAVEQRLGAVGVGVEHLVRGDGEVPVGQPDRDDRVTRLAVAREAQLDELVAVHALLERLPDHEVLEQRVAAGLGVVRDVEADVVERVRGQRDGLDGVGAVEPVEDRRGDLRDDVDFAGAQRLAHDVAVAVADPRDRRLGRQPAPPLVVAGDGQRGALLPLAEDERARAHGLVVRERLDLLGRHLAPEMLGHDRHDEARVVGLGRLEVELDGGRVGRLDRGQVHEELGVLPEAVVVDEVERVRHVRRGQRLAVLPCQAVAEVERDRLAVGRVGEVLGE
ncbi:MAG: hypothetical protein U0838_07855 [Chloroflexota bacterium]